MTHQATSANNTSSPLSPLQRWNSLPLYWRILIALCAGVVAGLLLGPHAVVFEVPSTVILQLLGALAPPLIMVAVTHVLMTTEITGRTAARLAGLLILNTTVAILIGLTIANVMQPGNWADLKINLEAAAADGEHTGPSPIDLLVNNVPKSILGPFGDKQNIIGVIFIAV
ncbi:MAG: cation:dicarboxylase symporter family transporter, partial [Planctomycetaceae bacterium]|nr:cation:dicarboxylase symporter family transporter [Planctomycetaceae bacterium]